MAYKVAYIPGDGIGPEVVNAARQVVDATGLSIEWQEQAAGLSAYEQHHDPLPQATLDAVRATDATLKGPTATASGSGFRSVNVALRQKCGLYANFRPARSIVGIESRYSDVDLIVIRAFAHQTAVEMAKHSSCSVINGLTDYSHPCQALADLYTLREHFGDLVGRKLAYVGDANNVARSLAKACAAKGMRFAAAAPSGYQFDKEFAAEMKTQHADFQFDQTDDPRAAVEGADAVYTDVWASMGQESEAQQRKQVFAPFQINAQLMRNAPSQAVFLHCLPAHRGEEVTDEVIDGPNSLVIQQAGNRMHVQKGIVTWILGAKS